MKVFFGSTMIPNRFQKLVMLLQMNFHRSSKTAISKSMNFKDETNRENDHEKTSRRLEEGEMSRGGNWMEMEPPKSKSNMTRRKANSNFNSNSDLAGSTALRASTSPTASPSSRDRNRRRNLKSKRRIKSSPSFFSRFISPIAILVVTSFLVIMVFLFYTRENDKKPTLKNPYHDNNDKLVATLDFDIVFEMPFQTQTPGAPSCETSLFPEEIDFTFVTQLSHNRLWMLNQHCQRWGANNPMSVAIYTNHTLTYDDLLSEILQSAPHCDLEYMLVQRITNDGVPKANYPINALRNLAISAVQTSHFVYADIDFFGAPNLYQILNLSTTKQTFSQDSKLAAVIPALAYKRACADENDCLEENLELMPQSPVDVYEKLKSVDVWPFDPYNQGGHGSTRLWDWCRQQDGTFVDIECFKSNRYEPYVAVRYCKHLPPFQEHFSGYGKNKLTQIMQMRNTGYRFAQLGGAFFVHYPHKDSGSRLEWDKYPPELEFDRSADNMRKARQSGMLDNVNFVQYKRGQIDTLFVRFRTWMKDHVEDEHRVPLCKDAMDDDAKLWVLNPKM